MNGRGNARVGGPVSGMVHRPGLANTVRTASQRSNGSSSSGELPSSYMSGEEKPIASGNGVTLSIALAEPVLFLQGFDPSELANQTTTMLRGSFHLRVSKTSKIKTISLSFKGRAETEWPEGADYHGICYNRLLANFRLLQAFLPRRRISKTEIVSSTTHGRSSMRSFRPPSLARVQTLCNLSKGLQQQPLKSVLRIHAQTIAGDRLWLA